jgi:hypothetical protein
MSRRSRSGRRCSADDRKQYGFDCNNVNWRGQHGGGHKDGGCAESRKRLHDANPFICYGRALKRKNAIGVWLNAMMIG